VQGFALPADEEKAAGPTAAAVAIPLPDLLAKADEKKGVAEARQCQTCHIFTEQGEKKPGPTLYGIINRKIGGIDGFAYSAGMKELAAAKPGWDYETLDKFLANPKGVVKNTAMQFAGINNAEKRANLIAYLRTLAKEPAPLPGK
jgi:cytochrome c